ncbi:MAG: ester cyclase [Ktedonobacteraceae bacterium]|nr:ester cyclase [Chloroflexota bacterium]
MSINGNKDVVLRFINEFWNGNNPDVLNEILDPAYYDYSFEPRNREGLERTLAITSAAFPGHETIIQEIVGEGDTVAVCETFRGTHSGPFRGFPASGKHFEVGRYHFFEVKGGKITSQRGLIDLPSLLRQIGMSD